MTEQVTVTEQVSAQLNFRLPGEWLVLDPREDVAARERIDELVLQEVGRADDDAILRRRFRDALVEALEGAQEAGAEMLYLCQELAGVPMPVAISVHLPQDLRMSPAIGTSPDAVLAVLRRSFEELKFEGIEDAVEFEIPESRILRTVRISEQLIEVEGESRQQRKISADYWYTLPGTKNVLLVNISTALGDIPHVMLGFFDSIAQASYFELPESMREDAPESPGEETSDALS